jgi:hypothetical protein
VTDRYTELLTVSKAKPGVKCAGCGKFIAVSDMLDGRAAHHFEPLSEFGPELSEWECASCTPRAA